MNPQIIQNQKNFFTRIFNQRVQKFDEFFSIKGFINDHPACLALIGHPSNHRQLVAHTAHNHSHRCFACWRADSAAHVGIDQSGLIALVNFCSFASCALLYAGVLPFKQGLHGLGLLLLRTLDGFLRGKTPAGKVFADAAHLQINAVLLADELAYSSSAPQAESIMSCSGLI